MKKNYLRYLPLLMLSPLLMANSPAPYPDLYDYRDLNVTTSFLDKANDQELGEVYRYSVTVNNTGDSLALLNHGINLETDHEGYYSTERGTIFYDEVLMPGKTETVIISCTNEMNFDDENDQWMTETLINRDDNVTFSNISVEEKNGYYQLNAKIKGTGDYYYTSIVELEYDGEIHYIEVRITTGKMMSSFDTSETLDLSKLKVNSITAYRSTNNTYKGGVILAWMIYGFFGLIILGMLLIPAAIIIPISIVRYRRNKRNNIAN